MRLEILTVGLLFPMTCSSGTVFSLEECPDGWTRSGSQCFALIQDKQHWPEAQISCQVLGGHLAHIHNSEENTVVGLMLEETEASEAWIGLNDLLSEGDFVWAHMNHAVTYTNWDVDQPSNWQGTEHCGAIRRNHKWNDNSCSKSRYFVCQTTV